MSVWIVLALLVIAYYYGKSKGYEAGKQEVQEYVLEVKKKD